MAKAAAEILRVLRPGGRLHLVDIGGDMTAHDGLPARLMMHSVRSLASTRGCPTKNCGAIKPTATRLRVGGPDR